MEQDSSAKGETQPLLNSNKGQDRRAPGKEITGNENRYEQLEYSDSRDPSVGKMCGWCRADTGCSLLHRHTDANVGEEHHSYGQNVL